MEQTEQGPELQRRATCSEHLEGVELADLESAAMFDIGPAEETLAALATADHVRCGGTELPQRVVLRDLAGDLFASIDSKGHD